MTMVINNGAPLLSGDILMGDLQAVIDFYNTNYPGFNMNYNPNIFLWEEISTSIFNTFCVAMGNCDDGWKGATALPDKHVFNLGDDIDDIQFKIPQPNFTPILGKEFFTSGNNSSVNVFTVPAGCQYMKVDWLMAGGGGGGYGNGDFYNGGDYPARGGGGGAFIENCCIRVQYGDVITFTIGDKGYAQEQNQNGSNGGDSFITIHRPSTGATVEIMRVGGGPGGMSNVNKYGDSWTAGGKLVRTFGFTGFDGARTPDGTMWNPDHNAGEWGGQSPLGTPGQGTNGNASGYGAGGGGGGFYD